MTEVSDVVAKGAEYAEVAIGAGAAAVAWVASKFEWVKAQPKWIKVAVAAGVFLAVALTLSAIQAIF